MTRFEGYPPARIVAQGMRALEQTDRELADLLGREHHYQGERLSLVASSSVAHPSVLAALASTAVNVTAEGRPGARFHAGCAVLDEIESLAMKRACELFKARYANVQAHSATTANQLVLAALLKPGSRILSMNLDAGGHLSHGHSAAFSGKYFEVAHYGVDRAGRIDMAAVLERAQEVRPQLIICGASAYSRTIDFAAFRRVADDVGALLLADISHTAGLVATGLHPSPVEHAHITTLCTHKQLCGPRGGLILSGPDADRPMVPGGPVLREVLERAVFPFFQGAPIMNAIAAKASVLSFCATEEYRRIASTIVRQAQHLAMLFRDLGYHVVSGGTDNHIIMLDLSTTGLTGVEAERALERCGITVNRNRVPGDTRPPHIASGVRIGTNTIAVRGLDTDDLQQVAMLVDAVLKASSSQAAAAALDEKRDAVRAQVVRLCGKCPIPWYQPQERND